MQRLLVISFLCAFSNFTNAQTVINAFAKVTNISGAVLTLLDNNESGDTFEADGQVIIMQMQGDVIGSTTDDATFGDLGAIGSVGLYEAAEISTVDRSSGLVSITLKSGLSHTFSTGANSSLQVVTFPRYTNLITTNELSTLAWDGSIGGVFAVDVAGTFTLRHNINIDGLGFRGGAIHTIGDESLCNPNIYTSSADVFGVKGEGIYKVTNINYFSSRGKILNGGGGGNPHNAGGAGGGNFTAGGDGGPGWENANDNGCTPSAGGLGGVDLSDYISASRIFMGGGGGGGQQNGGLSPAGTNGGGIIIVRANEVYVESGCTSPIISTNGLSSPSIVNDGGSGSGAGGSIILEVSTWTLDCSLMVQSNGGDGGDITDLITHGGGGGGGRGIIMFSGTVPGSNISVESNVGDGGTNDGDGGGGTAGTGTPTPVNLSLDPDGDGVVENESGPLPIDLLYWNVNELNGEVYLEWATSSELNNDYFTIEKSHDGNSWQYVNNIKGRPFSNYKIEYKLVDANPFVTTYYRLSQTDYDGTSVFYEVLMIKSELAGASHLVYPNPSHGNFKINITDTDFYRFRLIDMKGVVWHPVISQLGNELLVHTNDLIPGVYYAELVLFSQTQRFRVIIE
ncbi:MAG: T9SS type A sorting domain-containing protein [Reichenbachiella sp.]